MNCGLLLLATALFFNGCTANEHQPRPRTIFSSLKVGAFYQILQPLDIMGIINMLEADSNPDLKAAAISIFRERYMDYEIFLQHTFDENHPLTHVQDDQNKVLAITKYSVNLKILKHFGSEINCLRIYLPNMSTPDATIITQHINQYCSETVRKLIIETIKENTMEQFTKPFRNVEELEFRIDSHEPWDTMPGPLNHIFPNIRSLYLTLFYKQDYNLFDCTFPHLEYLNIFVTLSAGHPEEQLARFLLKNPQIRSANLRQVPGRIIDHVDELLPNLVDSAASVWEENNRDALQLDRLKTFSLYMAPTSTGQFIAKLKIPQLESLSVESKVGFPKEWTAFFREHKNITHLHMSDVYSGAPFDFTELTAELTNVVEFSFDSKVMVSVDEISQFIRNHPNLVKFRLTIANFPLQDMDTLRATFEDEYDVRAIAGQYGLRGLVFEKRE